MNITNTPHGPQRSATAGTKTKNTLGNSKPKRNKATKNKSEKEKQASFTTKKNKNSLNPAKNTKRGRPGRMEGGLQNNKNG